MYKFKCQSCGNTYSIPENEYTKLKLQVVYRAKLMGMHDLEITQFINLNAKCCTKPNYIELLDELNEYEVSRRKLEQCQQRFLDQRLKNYEAFKKRKQ